MQSNNRYMGLATSQPGLAAMQQQQSQALARQAMMQRNQTLAGLYLPNNKKKAPEPEPVPEKKKGVCAFVEKNKEVIIVAGGVALTYGYKYYQDKYGPDASKPAQWEGWIPDDVYFTSLFYGGLLLLMQCAREARDTVFIFKRTLKFLICKSMRWR